MMTLLLDYWKPILGFEGLYEISAYGHVRRVASGKGARPGLLKPTPTNLGYYRVSLSNNNRQFPKYVHHLVSEAFHGLRPQRMQINHRNGVKSTNWASNLEYMTRSDNMKHAVVCGLTPYGERNARAKLSEKDVIHILSIRGQVPIRDIAVRFKVTRDAIEMIYKGNNWKHLPRGQS